MKNKSFFSRLGGLLLALILAIPAMSGCSEDLEENQISVKWHMGMVSSDLHEESPLALLDGEEGYSYSDIITIPKPGTCVTFTDNNGEDAIDGGEYADEKVFVLSHWVEENGEWVIDHPGDNYTGLDGRSGEITEIRRGEYATYTYISSYPNEKIRLCYASGQTKKNTRKMEFAKVYMEQTFEEGTLISSKSNVLKDIAVGKFLKTAKDTSWYSELEGITLYAMGDSYFGGSSNGKAYVWPNLMAQKYGMNFSNWGIGGSSVATGGYMPMCNRISQMSDGSPDIVLLEGGRNDFCSGSILVGDPTDSGTVTFCGAVNSCIAQLKAKYPNALIIGITCWKHEETNQINGEKQQQYADAMLAVFERHGLPCFDATDEAVTGVHMDEYSFRSQYCQNDGDISHLNTAGMILVEPAFEKFIAEEYQAFLASKQGQ
ncbi:MAG: SGNH/GDSL hydrolase family protein [Ruminococcaceae bacterium]|nr:SGNH/GDSL hydrolase family protein [Oscillospiraceae bacterium]